MTDNGKVQAGASDQIAEHSESEGRLGRRALLAGAAAAGVGVAATVVSRPGAASAADGSPLLLGDAVSNAASTLTTVTTTGAGGLVWNASTTGTTAVTGADTASSGGYGVQGTSTNGIGVYGQTSSADVVHDGAVVGYNGSGGNALVGKVNGSTAGAQGVLGSDTTTVAGGYGVVGESTNGIGVYGQTSSADVVHDGAVVGYNGSGGNALVGKVNGSTAGAQGVLGSDTTTVAGGYGVVGKSTNGYGLAAQGGLAPLFLAPASAAGAPTSGTHTVGEVYVDSEGVIYRCLVAGEPGTWVPLTSTILLPTPVLVVDTRKGTGGITGPLTPSKVYTSSVITGGSTGIPAAAKAVIGTIIYVAATAQDTLGTHGYLEVFPAGASLPGVSNVNAGLTYAIATGVTVGLGKGSNAGKVSFVVLGTSSAAHAVMGVAGYII